MSDASQQSSDFLGGGSIPPSLSHLPWENNSQFNLVVHAITKCDTCRKFLLHYGEGMVNASESMTNASRLRDSRIIEASGVSFKMTTMEANVERYKADYNYIWSQHKSVSKELLELQGHNRELEERSSANLAELLQLREEVKSYHIASNSAPTGKKQHHDTDSIPNDGAAMVVDDEGGPNSKPGTSYSRDNPPWEDGRY
ncbi:hypothetical protein L218DRAFT_1081243 [Marasmius fiardii PR-910]|nr:hypothetical protein L218DRAFT_1081243 [Marasmius fiardii PR-910]